MFIPQSKQIKESEKRDSKWKTQENESFMNL